MFSPISDVTERFMALSKEWQAADIQWMQIGLTREQRVRYDAIEAEMDALYPQLPAALRDSWEN